MARYGRFSGIVNGLGMITDRIQNQALNNDALSNIVTKLLAETAIKNRYDPESILKKQAFAEYQAAGGDWSKVSPQSQHLLNAGSGLDSLRNIQPAQALALLQQVEADPIFEQRYPGLTDSLRQIASQGGIDFGATQPMPQPVDDSWLGRIKTANRWAASPDVQSVAQPTARGMLLGAPANIIRNLQSLIMRRR